MIPDNAEVNQATGEIIIDGVTYSDIDDYFDSIAPIDID